MVNEMMEPEQGSGKTPRRWGFWKFVIVFILIIIGALFVAEASVWYSQWHGRREVDKMAESLRQLEGEQRAAEMADTYGGRTPQETLQMYIEAVEKGDYELASKYFTVWGQKKELENLKESPRENIEEFIKTLNKLELDDKEAGIREMYENDVRLYNIEEPFDDYRQRIGKIYEGEETMSTKVEGYVFSVSFKLYPSGVWKILEM